MSVWTDFGFRQSPYNTEPVPASKDGEFLLVGRTEDLDDLEVAITSSTLHATVEGDNGVGKTSLASVAGYRLHRKYIDGESPDLILPIGHSFQLTADISSEDFEERVYYAVAQAFIDYHDFLASRGRKIPDIQAINKWLNSPISRSGGFGVSVLGSGGNLDRGSEPNATEGFTYSGFRATVRRWLSDTFADGEGGGFVAVIDNLELLETSQAARTLLGEMRDTVLAIPNVKWVLCGARGIVRSGASSQRLEGRLAAPLEVAPIADDDVAVAVERRTQLYKLRDDAIPPVGPLGFRHLYEVLNRNLRNTLKYCEDFTMWLRKNSPDSPDEDSYFELLQVWLTTQADNHREATKLGSRAWEVFDGIADRGGSVSPSDYDEFGFNSNQAMRPHLKALEDLELIQSTLEDQDKRRKTIVLTPRAWLIRYARAGYKTPDDVAGTS